MVLNPVGMKVSGWPFVGLYIKFVFFFRRVLETFVDISFARKFILTCTCIGPAVCCFADGTFSLIMPQALFALKWNQVNTLLFEI